MKLRVQGTPEELREKGPQLVKALAERLGVDLVSLLDEETLQKAMKERDVTSHYAPIQELVKRSSAIYNEEIDLMMKEITDVLKE